MMIRKAKTLGLVLVAVLGMSAFASATASADFDSEAASTTITGSQVGPFHLVLDPGTTTCKTVTLHGSAAGTTVTGITITPTFKECTLVTPFGPIAVTVNFNECDYLFTTGSGGVGQIHLECPSGKTVTVVGPGCSVTVPAQTLDHVLYKNTGVGSGRDIDFEITISGIAYSYSGFTCGSGSGTKNGTHTGSATLKGTNPFNDASVGIWYTP